MFPLKAELEMNSYHEDNILEIILHCLLVYGCCADVSPAFKWTVLFTLASLIVYSPIIGLFCTFHGRCRVTFCAFLSWLATDLPSIFTLSPFLIFSAGADICSANANGNSGVGKFQCSCLSCPWDTSHRKDPTKGSCWIIMLSSRKLAITAETIPQESTQLSNRTQLCGIWFPVR